MTVQGTGVFNNVVSVCAEGMAVRFNLIPNRMQTVVFIPCSSPLQTVDLHSTFMYVRYFEPH
jgi:hypothetical protein